jgi:hypothetical protein
VAALEAKQPLLDLGQVGEVVGVKTLRWTMEKWISIWLSQEACTGRWTRRRLWYLPSSRWMDARPRWKLPLSTTQNTRSAEA